MFRTDRVGLGKITELNLFVVGVLKASTLGAFGLPLKLIHSQY